MVLLTPIEVEVRLMISESLQHLDVALQISITNCAFEREAFVMKRRQNCLLRTHSKYLD